jgi:glyoxylase-like metal-dependent hydrolase (beta-lactamase superfamily II)
MIEKSANVMVDIVCEQLNPDACKTYLIGVKESQEAVLIDPVIDHINDYVILLEERKLTLSMVIDTHTH